MSLSQYLRDTKTHIIPLKWDGEPFVADENWHLIFTAKRKATDPDSEAVFQKASGLGITVEGSNAHVTIIPQDTADEVPGDLYIDIQAENLTVDDSRTVAVDRLRLGQEVTHERTTSVPIYTTEPGVPYTGPPGADGEAVTTANVLLALGVPTFADLPAANAALTIGTVFYNTALSKIDITTA